MSDARRKERIGGKQKSAEESIDDIFSDTSVPPAATRAALEHLRNHIDMLLETLPRKS